MEWFGEWWRGLGLTGQIMACAAIPMTVVMLLQMILMIIGIGGGGDADGDTGGGVFHDGHYDHDGSFDHNADIDHDGGLHHDVSRIFTIRGIVAFFALGGWAGLAALTAGIPSLWAIMIALVSGAAAMLLASFIIKLALKMQSSGNLDLNNALSQTAEVYITIPAMRKDSGKITMILQERFVELDAVTDWEDAIKPRAKVEIVGLSGADCLVVRPVIDNNSEAETN